MKNKFLILRSAICSLKLPQLLLIGLFCSIGLLAQKPKLVLPVGHPQGIIQVTGTPDGKYLFSRSFNDANVRLWSIQTGMMVAEIKPISRAVNIIPSSDNKYLLINSVESLTYWDIENNKAAFSIENSMNGVVLSGDNQFIMGTQYKQLFIYQTVDGKKTFEKTMADTICSFDFININQILVVSKNKNSWKFIFYDILKDSLIHEFELKDLGDWQFYHHGKYDFIISNNSRSIRTYLLSVDGHTIYKQKKRKSLGNSNGIIDFCPITGKYLIGFSEKSTIQVVDPDSSLYYYRNDFKEGITSAVFVNNGKNIAVKTDNNFSLEYFSDKLDYCNILFANAVGDFKNIPAPIFYQSGTKRFYAVLDDNIIREFESDADTCKQVREYLGMTSEITDFAHDEDTIYISNGTGSIKKISLNTGIVLDDFKLSDYSITGFHYDKENGRLMSMDFNHHVGIFDSREKKLLRSFTFEKQINSFGYFTYPRAEIAGNHLLMGFFGFKYADRSKGLSYYELRDKESFNVIKNFKPDKDSRFLLRLNNTGSELICINQTDSTVSIRDFNFKTIRALKINALVMGGVQSKTGKYLIVLSNDLICLYDYANGNRLYQFPSLLDNDVSFDISPNDSLLIFNSDRGTVEIYDIQAAKKLGSYFVHDALLVQPFFIDNKRFVTISEDGFLKYWKIKEQGIELIFSMVPFQNTDYAVLIPSGYYKCTSNAAKQMHYINDGIKVITFEQLDVKYNRPDKVLEAIGCTDTALINSYRKAYYKRIKKLGIDTTTFREGYSVPEADFANRAKIENKQKSEKLNLHLTGLDRIYKLDRFNVWINEVPLFGLRGISIKAENKNFIDTSLTITLSQGENRIETSITNVNGTESYRMPLSVHYDPEVTQKETIYFIGIGIDKFSDERYNLNYSVKDIRDLSLKLKEKYGGHIIIDTLYNENVTINKVKALKQKLLQTNENDKVIISYSGHGLLSKEYDYYLSTYGVNFEKPEINGLPYDDLERLMDSIPARKKLLLIDACHSGEVDKDEAFEMDRMADSLGLARVKGMEMLTNEKHVGITNSFELMQSLFVNVGKNTGTIIISAAAGNQYAQERGNLKNGVFTYSILEALNKYPTMKITELKKIVGERVVQLTHGLQKPTYRNETIAVDWLLW